MNKFDDLVGTIDRLILRAMKEALQQLLESGFELPIYIVVVGANGSLVLGQYPQSSVSADEELDIEILSSRERPEGYVLPINIIFVDSQGEAARLFIQTPDKYNLSSFSRPSAGHPPGPSASSGNKGKEESIAVEEIKRTKCPKCGEDLAWIYYCDLCCWYDEDEAKGMRQRSKTGVSWEQIIKHLILEAKASRKLLAAGVPVERFSFMIKDMEKVGEIENILREIRGKNLFMEDNQLIEEGAATVAERILKEMNN